MKKESSRTNSSIKNSCSSLIANILAIFIGFLAQACFIRILNAEYLGLNGLFTNILTMLSFFELGIGNAIVFYMYKPLAEKDNEKIQKLMKFYKKSYRIIAGLVFTTGILILPFIKYLISEVTLDVNIYWIYFLFLLSTVVSYLMSYKKNMIYADQKNYYINIIHSIYLIVLNATQLLLLYFTKNYYLYLIIKIICQLFENLVITVLVNRLYPFLTKSIKENLDKETEKNIFKKVRALVLHKIGYIIINGTDNIIISKYFGLVWVGIYSNYYLITNSVYNMFSQAIGSLTSSVGNLLVDRNCKKNFEVFKKIRFVNFIISTFCATSILVLVQPFISVWVGKQFLLGNGVLYAIVFNSFQKMQRCTYNTFKDSAGVWEEDKFIPILESIFNIVFSIICLKIVGLAGVFLGTIISGLTLWLYSYPKYVYKKIFKRNYISYLKETIGYIFLFLIIAIISILVVNNIRISNVYITLIVNCLINCIINAAVFFIIFRKSENFKYFYNLIFGIIKKMTRNR